MLRPLPLTILGHAIRFVIQGIIVAISATPMGLAVWIWRMCPPLTRADHWVAAGSLVVAFAMWMAIAFGLLSGREE